MFRNYFKIAMRNITRHKLFSFINIVGLAVGLATTFIILLVVQGEMKFETHHDSGIFRINKKYVMKGDTKLNMSTPHPLREALLEEIPGIISAVHLTRGSSVIKKDNKVFNETDNYYTSPEIFDVFNFEILSGSVDDVFRGDEGVAISRTLAERYFGEVDVAGRSLRIDNLFDVVITAVYEDMPIYTNYRFSMLQSINRITQEGDRGNWFSHWLETFILVDEAADLRQIENKIDAMMKEHLSEDASGAVLQSLKDTHLYSVEGKPTAWKYVIIFSSVALLILAIALFNFINLSTAQAARRAREVGVRKIVGAHKKALIAQFIIESLVYIVIAFIIALFLVELGLPLFEKIAGRAINLDIVNVKTFLIIGTCTLFLGLLAGFYPAIILSSFSPVNIFKTKLSAPGRGLILRTVIVIAQFTLAIILLIGTGVIYGQLRFMQNKDLGFRTENLMYIKMDTELKENYETFAQELDKIPGVVNFSRCSSLPNRVWSIMRGLSWEGNPEGEGSSFAFIAGDKSFVETVDLTIIKGRDFSEDLSSDANAVLINEKSIDLLGVEDPIGMKFDDDYEVVGVVKNFNSLPLNYEIEPLFIANIPMYLRFIVIRVAGDDLSSTISNIEDKWATICPNTPFEYRFLDENFNSTYNSEIRAGLQFRVFAALGIFIACLGLFGLASFLTEQRMLEIGVRKVMGSTSRGIIWQLARGFLRWVVIANIIAWPLAWYIMSLWMKGFVYRADINPVIFIISGLVSIILSFLTIGLRTWSAASMPPAKILKYQ